MVTTDVITQARFLLSLADMDAESMCDLRRQADLHMESCEKLKREARQIMEGATVAQLRAVFG